MKSLKILVASLIACATIQSASAIALIEFTPNSTGPVTPLINFEGFADGPNAVGFSGGNLSYNGATIVQANSNSSGATPFPASGDYLSVMQGGWAEFAFLNDQHEFGFQWGSLDGYNTISFYLGAASVGSFTGTDVAASPVFANGNQGFNGSAYVVFGGDIFDRVVLTSSRNSFEIDNVNSNNVPDSGATVALLGLGLIGLAAVRRKL